MLWSSSPTTQTLRLPPGQLFDQRALRGVGVLIFVDEDIVKLAPVFFQHLRAGVEQHGGIENQVVEVQRGELFELFLIRVVNLADVLFPHVVRAQLSQIARGQDMIFLCAGDGGEDAFDRQCVGVDIRFLHDLCDKALGVVRIIDGKGVVVADVMDILAQNAHADRMEGAGPDVLGGGAEHRLEALLELARSLVGEGDAEDVPRTRGRDRRRAQELGQFLFRAAFEQRVHRGDIFLGAGGYERHPHTRCRNGSDARCG